MEEVVYYNDLFDCYGELLTDKQREYFIDYYQNNLSLSEMAINYDVSRNAIHKQLKKIIEILENYEVKLAIISRNNKIMDLIKSLNDDKLLSEIIHSFSFFLKSFVVENLSLPSPIICCVFFI